MKIAVMQPYFYPYVGYFEMISQVDIFVCLTDVQYIRRGWVNRNRIRSSSNEGFQYITVPVNKSPQNTLIHEMIIDDSKDWQNEHYKQLVFTYGKKALDHPLFPVYDHGTSLVDLLIEKMRDVMIYLKIKARMIDSREINTMESGENRIIEICNHLGADCYINLPGGVSLYNEDAFASHGIKLEFHETKCLNRLSILDACIGEGYSL